MTALEKHHAFRTTSTPCPRCKQAGHQVGGASWLYELSLADGVQSVHALVCKRPQCAFAEIIGLRAELPVARVRRPWLRNAIARYPLTFAAAAVVNGIVLGLFFALT
jgi:hypothetical protein